MPRPNVILILCDQMRGDALRADGNRFIETPNIDYLASRGTRFRRAYTAVPSCIPARSILWSGQRQWHTGVLGQGRGQGPMPNDFAHTIAGEFARAGYRTHLVGKGHFNPHRASMGFQTMELDESGRMPDSEHRQWFRTHAPEGVTPDDHGVAFNSWHARPWHTEEHLHPTAWTMSRSLAFLESHDCAQPFFLNISFARPHSPYVPPRYYFDLYHNRETPPPHVGEWSARNDDPVTAVDPNAWRGKQTPEAIHRARAAYYGEVSFIDTQIGRLMNWCSRYRRAAWENSWIVFVADHGDMQGDHHLWRKNHAYEGSARIPFIVVPPKEFRGAKRAVAYEVVELRDIMPTLFEAAGIPIPPTAEGRSLLPLLDAPASDWRLYIHGEHSQNYSQEQEMQYVTDGRRKFIWLPRINVEQFFDLESDPGERVNLIDDPSRQSEIATWRGYLVKELAERDCGWVVDGKLHCPPDPLVSPWKDVRWMGTR